MFNKNHTFVIAEAGINHNGNYNIAKKLLIAAKGVGADAVKFQAFKAKELIIESALAAAHVKGKKSFFELIKSWELSQSEYEKLSKLAKKLKILFFASSFDMPSLRMLEKIQVSLHKVPSSELTNHYLLEEMAKTKKPIIVSTGMGDDREIKKAVSILEKNRNELGIMHCVSIYPPAAEEFNLNKIIRLKKQYGRKHTIGYSDHSLDIFVPVSTIPLGARIIEKHFTLDKNMPGPDQPSSADPKEFKKMVDQIRYLEKAVGTERLVPTKREKETRKAFRKSLVANRHIKKGETITFEMIGMKRPGTGIPTTDMSKVLGKTAKVNISYNSLIRFSELK